MPLAHFSKTDFAMSRGLFARNSSARANRQMLRSWDVRVERDIAAAYTMRIVAELKTRGVIPTSPELGSWSDQLRNESLGPSRDFVVGAETVEELNTDELQLLCAISAVRERYGAYLVDQLGAESPSSFSDWSERR